MTDEKSQVAVKLTAKDIEKYFVNNTDQKTMTFLKTFKKKELSIYDFKYSVIGENDFETFIMLMDNNGQEHECIMRRLFMDNIERILTAKIPQNVFKEVLLEECLDKMRFLNGMSL